MKQLIRIQGQKTHGHDPDEKDHVAGEQEEDGDLVEPLDVEPHLRGRDERAAGRERRGRRDRARVEAGVGRVVVALLVLVVVVFAQRRVRRVVVLIQDARRLKK